jgi:hypothetical protein
MSLSGMGGLGPRKDAFSNFGKIVYVRASTATQSRGCLADAHLA